MKLDRLPLPALLAQWARSVDYLDRHPVSAEEFAHDVLLRHEIARRIQGQPVTREVRELLADLDEAFRAVTEPQAACVLGEAHAEANGWTASREWYAWRAAVPHAPSV